MADIETLYAVYQDRGPTMSPKVLAMERTEGEAGRLLENYRSQYLNLSFFTAPYTPVSYGYVT